MIDNKIIIAVITSIPDNPRLIYTIQFLQNHPAFKSTVWKINDKKADVKIGYGKHEKLFDYSIPTQGQLFHIDTQINSKNIRIRQFSHGTEIIYGVVAGENKEAYFLQNNRFGFDIFESIFFMISRYEEVYANQNQIGQTKWLNESEHLVVKENIFHIPLVDQLCFIVASVIIDRMTHKSTYSISHDIDILYRFKPWYKFLRSLAATIFYKRGWTQFYETIKHFWRMKRKGISDPYDNFSWLLRKEGSWKEKSLYLMSGGNSAYDNKYELKEGIIDEIIIQSRQKGYDIGIHPSYNAYNSEKMYLKEIDRLKNKLKKEIQLNRQHCLRWDWKVTPYLIKKAGIKLDSSMGFNRHLGFRCGTGFPYQLYDFQNECAFNFEEHPFAYMESSAIHFCRNSGKDIIQLSEEFIQQNRFNTHILFNFHNSNFDTTTDHGKKLTEFYRNRLMDIIER